MLTSPALMMTHSGVVCSRNLCNFTSDCEIIESQKFSKMSGTTKTSRNIVRSVWTLLKLQLVSNSKYLHNHIKQRVCPHYVQLAGTMKAKHSVDISCSFEGYNSLVFLQIFRVHIVHNLRIWKLGSPTVARSMLVLQTWSQHINNLYAHHGSSIIVFAVLDRSVFIFCLQQLLQNPPPIW